MPSPLDQYDAKSADWRSAIKRNQRRTRAVMLVFILIYLALGLLIDLYINARHYPQTALSVIFSALITFKITPIATIVTTIIAIVCLWVTYLFHDQLILLGAEYYEVTPETAKNLREKQLYNTIEEMKVAAGLQFMPKVYIIEAPYMNAFASGYSEKSAMVAITRGLLDKLDRDELQAVMAHELSHIRHLDIKLTLMASVLANIMILLIDMLFWGALFSDRGDRRDREGGNWLFIVIMILRYLLPLITVLLMLFLSRTREYMADAGCVELMRDNGPLARALLKIQGDHEANSEAYAAFYNSTPHEGIRREAYIFDPVTAGISVKSSLSDVFSTHPSIEKRLAAIGFKQRS